MKIRTWTFLMILLLGTTLVLAQSETRESLALTYPQGPTISVSLKGTDRLPRASGEAKVERKKGITEIEIELDEMKPARYFGGDLNTYVLWVVSPEGLADNLGEFILSGNRTKLNVSTTLETFGMFVTAEPHFLVSSPSRMVVLENVAPRANVAPLKISRIKYRGFEGTYEHWRASLKDVPERKERVEPHANEARTSVLLAQRAAAEEYAPTEFRKAKESLDETERALEEGVGDRNLMLLGHRTVRLAVEAENLARERAFEAALRAERESNAQRISDLKDGIARATDAAEKARLEAEQRQLQLQMEQKARRQAMEEAREAAAAAARAEAKARDAEEERLRAEREAMRASAEAAEAARELNDARGQLAETEKELTDAQKRMRAALSRVVEIRETARGLILNLPDILFDFDRATLKPEAREVVSRVVGILSVTQDYQLKIGGHTDSIGSEEYNQKLSMRRAEAVRDYFVEAGLGDRIVEVQGFGESQPVAPNDTSKNRQKNRRVEIIIQESAQLQLP